MIDARYYSKRLRRWINKKYKNRRTFYKARTALKRKKIRLISINPRQWTYDDR